MLLLSAELSGAPKALVDWPALVPNTGVPVPPPKRLPPPAFPAPNAGLLFPPNKLPALLFVFAPPKPPNPPEPPAVAVVEPNILLLEVGLLPKAGRLLPKAVVEEGAPKPVAVGNNLLAGAVNIDEYAFCFAPRPQGKPSTRWRDCRNKQGSFPKGTRESR